MSSGCQHEVHKGMASQSNKKLQAKALTAGVYLIRPAEYRTKEGFRIK